MRGLFVAILALSCELAAGPVTTDNHIKVDQFGYRPADTKIAVISSPVVGYNSSSAFTPGATYELRRWSDDVAVFLHAISAWNGGATHAQSGDKVWWFDFSSVTAAGSYYVFDPTVNVGSYRFDIADCAYNAALRAAFRTFYYQRCGTAKSAPSAGTGWTDGECHTGTQQDRDCRLYSNTAATTSKDLHGGWHDAGDYNKYVNFAWATVMDLLLAYEESPSVWGDAMGIPESGNGTSDLLDEVKFELDWFLRMQQPDGSVLSVVGGGGATPPSADHVYRRYGPATTAATYTVASMCALASIKFASAGNASYAATLRTAAVNAWTWAEAHQGITFYNSGTLAAGEQEPDAYGVLSRRLASACFLFALTGEAAYKTFFDAHYGQMHLIQWTFAYPFETSQQDVLLYYAKLAQATGSVASAIRTAYSSSMKTGNENLPSYAGNTDAYRAYLKDADYTWGSNSNKCHKASMYQTMNVLGLDATNSAVYTGAALGIVNYMHGVNPQALVYLSNMSAAGAENSVSEFYHSWFAHGSAVWDRVGTSTYGPAPGFVTGGPNPSWALDGCCATSCAGATEPCTNLSPPSGQPVQKSYRDWNTSWPQNSWSVTENGIYYQAAYLRMLSKVAGATCAITREGRVRTGVIWTGGSAGATQLFTPTGRVVRMTDAFGRTAAQRCLVPRGVYLQAQGSEVGVLVVRE